jgi:hypothetical protein
MPLLVKPPPVLSAAPTTIRVPSADILTLLPLCSPPTSPGISPPDIFDRDPYIVGNAPGGATIALLVEVIDIGEMGNNVLYGGMVPDVNEYPLLITALLLKSGVTTLPYVVPSHNFQLEGNETPTPLHMIIPPIGIDVST